MAEQLSMFEPPKRKSGLLYLPKYLTIADQKDLLNDLRTVVRQSPLFTPTMSSGAPFRYKMTNIGDLGWNSDRQGYRYESKHPVTGQPYPEIPSSLRSMIDDLSGKFGEKIRPDAVLLNWYSDGAKLGLHVDSSEKVSKPVVSLSLGDRGVFAIDTTGSRDRSTAMKNLERINVNSGDAIVFGGDLRNAYHAVERIDAGTAPPELGMKNSGRINLTARQVNKISGGGFGNSVSKLAKGFAIREGSRLLAKQLGANEDQQQAVADTVTAANILGSVYQNVTKKSGIFSQKAIAPNVREYLSQGRTLKEAEQSLGKSLFGYVSREDEYMNLYSQSLYSGVNRDLRSPNPKPDLQISASAIQDTLATMPNYEGVSYRGISVPNLEEALNKFGISKGSIYSDPAFTSYSENLDIAKDFAKKSISNRDRIIFTTSSKSGSLMGSYAQFGAEKEILFPAGFPQKVKSVDVRKEGFSNVAYVELQDTPESVKFAKDFGLSDKKKAVKEAIASPENASQILRDELSIQPKNFTSKQKKNFGGVISPRDNASNFEFGQKFIAPKTGEIVSLSAVKDDGSVVLQDRKGVSLEVPLKDFGKYKVKPSPNLDDLKAGDGLVKIANATDTYRDPVVGDRLTILSADENVVRGYTDTGDYTILKRSQVPEFFRPNPLGISSSLGNPIAKLAKGFAIREGARLLAKELGADEQQQQAIADTVTVANVAASFADNSRVNNMAANKKINSGSLSTSVKESKPQKLTTDTLYKYLQMMGGEPVIVKPDGKQATKGKFAFGQDVGLNNEFTKLPEIHVRFDDPKISSLVAKELATGELTVGMQRNPQTGEVETTTKKFEPIPSRGNTQLRGYRLGNDPTGDYLAFNKPEEAYKAPKSLKELQADIRKSYQTFGLKPDATIADLEAAVMPIMTEAKNSPELRDRLQTVLTDMQSRQVLEPVATPEPVRSPVAPAPVSVPEQTLDTPSDAWKFPQQNERKLPNFYPQMASGDNPLGTGATVQSTYDRAKSAYEGYQGFGYAPSDRKFPTLREMVKLAESEGVKGDEAIKAYIKGKQNAPLIDAGVITPPELPLTARLGQEYISPKSGKVGTVESVGKKGVKLNVDGQVVPLEYQTLEKLKYTGNKGYGITSNKALDLPAKFAKGFAMREGSRLLAKQLGADEDQQQAVADTVTAANVLGSVYQNVTKKSGAFSQEAIAPNVRAKTPFDDIDDNPFKGGFNFDDDSDPFPFPENTSQKATSSEVKAKLANIAPDVRAKIDNFRNFPEPITRNLTSNERLLGVARYDLPSEGSTSGVNRPLRGDWTINDDGFYDSAVSKRFAVSLQDDLLSASTNPQITYRGMHVYEGLLDKIGLKPNSSFYDKGFMSTSPNPNIVRNYGDGSGLEVMGKAGYRLPTQHDWLGGEVLYPAGNQFDVENYQVDDSGKFTARLVDRNLAPNEVVDLKKQALANAKSSGNAADKAFQKSYTLGTEGFEYGQKFVSPKGGAASLVDATDPSSLMFQTLDGKTVYVDQKQFDRLQIKAPATLTDLKRGDGLIANKSDLRYTVMETTPDAVKLRGEDGNIKTARKSQVPEMFRPNSLGFAAPAALRPMLGGFAGGTLGSIAFKQLAKAVGLNEDQQNAAAATGGLIGSLTGSALTNVPANTKLRLPTAREFATTMMGTPQSRSAGARLFDLASSQSGAVVMGDRQSTGATSNIAPKSLSDLQKQRAKLDAYNPDSKPIQAVREFKPVPKLSLEEAAAIMGVKPNEYDAYKEKVYQETDFLKSKQYQEVSERIAQQRFNQQQPYFDALKAWNKAGDPSVPMPRKEDFAQPMKRTFDMQATLSEASMRAKKATTSGFGKSAPSAPKSSNFIAESAVESAAKSTGATTQQVKAAIASQRASGLAPDLNKATEVISVQQSKQLATRTQPSQSKALSTRVLSRQQSDGMIATPSQSMIDAGMKPQRVKIGDRIGASGLGVFMDTAQAANVLTESASRGENTQTALTRAGASAGAGYVTTGLASFIPNPYLRTAAQIGGGIAAVVGADKAIDLAVGRNEAKEQKFAKDLSKLDLQTTNEKEQWKPFANDSNIAAAFGNSFTAQIQSNLDYRPAARSLANLTNSQAIANARLASERDTSIKAGMDAKSNRSIAYEDLGEGKSRAFLRDRGYTSTESRVLALQNLANESGYEVPRTGKFNSKTLDALEKLGYSQSQISEYIQGKTKAIGKPRQVEKAGSAVRQVLNRNTEKVTGQQLSQALAAERKAQGLKGGEMLSQGQVDQVFSSLAGRSLTQLRQSTKVGGNKTQSALRLGVGIK